jgi:hypothetical protein
MGGEGEYGRCELDMQVHCCDAWYCEQGVVAVKGQVISVVSQTPSNKDIP